MKLFITLTCVIISDIVFACDFCGCFMGITPYDNQSSISMMYRYKSFNGYNYTSQNNSLFPQNYKTSTNNSGQTNYLKHGSSGTQTTSLLSQNDYELYTTAELRGKFFIHQRVELNAIIPFVMNSNQLDNEKETIQGMGDVTFFSGFHLINKTMTEKFQHRLILGAGIKVPTGSCCKRNDEGERVDYLLQAGTGSLDYMAYVNYVFGYKKFGVNFNSTYKMNGENKYHERMGNSTANYLNIFYKFRQDKNLKIFPSIQGFYEYTNGEYIGDTYQAATRMSSATAGIGIDVFFKNISVNTLFSIPVYEKKIANNMALAGKFLLGITYNFNQKKYLLKSKKES